MRSKKTFDIAIKNGFNASKFNVISNESAINLFQFQSAMISTPGFETIYSELSGLGEGRGLYYSFSLDEVVVILGNMIYSLKNNDYNLLGTLDSLTGRVYFSENGLLEENAQLIFSDGIYIYVYQNNELIKARTDDNDVLGFTPGTLTYQDGFFFCNDLSSNRIYASQLNNGIIWPVLNYTTISEKTQSCISFKNLLYVFGERKTEVFYNTSQEFFPFSKILSHAWEYGCYAPESLSAAYGQMTWLGSTKDGTPSIYSSEGGNPKVISNESIEAILDDLVDKRNCNGFMFQEFGQFFYQINFNNDKDNISFIYNFVTNTWSKITNYDVYIKSPISFAIYNVNTDEVWGLMKDERKIVHLSLDIYNYDGKIIPRIIISPNYTFLEENKILDEVHLQIEQGQNQNESKVLLYLSKDRGRVYELHRTIILDNIAERKELLRFLQLGAFKWITFKFEFYSLDRFIILDAKGTISET